MKDFVAFYLVIKDVAKRGYVYQHLYTTIPLLIEAESYEKALKIAKTKCDREMILDEVMEINEREKNNILKFYY